MNPGFRNGGNTAETRAKERATRGSFTSRAIPRSVLATLLAFGLVGWLAAVDYEGTFTAVITTKGKTTESSGVLKGKMAKIIPKQAMEIEKGVEGYPIINFAKKKITLISPKDKYWLDMSLDQFIKTIDAKSVAVKQSGKKDTLLGHVVEEWVLDEPASGLDISLWATRDYSVGVNLFISLQKLYPEEGLALGRMGKIVIDQGCLPLKAMVKDKTGAIILEWQIVAATPGPVKDDEFAIPAGYGKMSDVLKKNRGSGNR